MLDILKDTLIDALKLVPFLLIAFLLIEVIEHKLSAKNKKLIGKSNKFGPIVGSTLGIIPQCGFSVVATNLYATRIITLGTLISIYLSTSDEMLPIMLSQNADFSVIAMILGIKFIIGIIAGFIINLVIKDKKENTNYEICDDEHCHCEDGIIKSSIIHTLKTLLFILISTFIINCLFTYLGEETLANLLLKNNIFGPFITSLIGLIPNCGASIVITELYLNNAISLGATISGLLTGSGIALLILFKTNKNLKLNLLILSLMYFIGAISGMIIELISFML